MNKNVVWGRFCASKGFTLIELLVVVLIIGILAAEALPQYKKAVIKSRLTQGIVFAKAVHDAEEVYYLANGSYTDFFEKLDVDVTCPADWTCELNANRMAMKLPSKFVSSGSSLEIVYSHTKRSDDKVLANILYCVAPQNTPEAIICEGMGKYFGRNDNGFVRYQLH